MGCDIHCFAEKKINDKYEFIKEVFDNRSYGIFGFMANVRNSSQVPPLVTESRGLPSDISAKIEEEVSYWDTDAHSFSFLTLKELNEFDYSRSFEDRRFTKQTGPNSWDGAATCEEGEGKKITFKEFLGEWFFKELKEVTDLGAERIVFWFDN